MTLITNNFTNKEIQTWHSNIQANLLKTFINKRIHFYLKDQMDIISNKSVKNMAKMVANHADHQR